MSRIYHYVYIISNVVEQKQYIGCRSSNVPPEDDIGKRYFSSSRDKEFMTDQRENHQNYVYEVVDVFVDRKSAIELEIVLHETYDVGRNPRFYNNAKQTSVGFSNAGRVGYKHTDETKAKIKESQRNRMQSEEVRAKIREKSTGKVHTEETKAKISKNNGNIKLANIYNHLTKELIAEEVCISKWAKENGYHRGHLLSTATADRSQPNNSNNRHQHKGIYAVYIDNINSIWYTDF